MSFTDDNLKRLKEHLEGDSYLSNEWADARKLIPALISRLEAAEDLIESRVHNAYEKWRKACGK